MKPILPADLGPCPTCGGAIVIVSGLGKPVEGGPCRPVTLGLCRSPWCGHPRARELRAQHGEVDRSTAKKILAEVAKS